MDADIGGRQVRDGLARGHGEEAEEERRAVGAGCAPQRSARRAGLHHARPHTPRVERSVVVKQLLVPPQRARLRGGVPRARDVGDGVRQLGAREKFEYAHQHVQRRARRARGTRLGSYGEIARVGSGAGASLPRGRRHGARRKHRLRGHRDSDCPVRRREVESWSLIAAHAVEIGPHFVGTVQRGPAPANAATRRWHERLVRYKAGTRHSVDSTQMRRVAGKGDARRGAQILAVAPILVSMLAFAWGRNAAKRSAQASTTGALRGLAAAAGEDAGALAVRPQHRFDEAALDAYLRRELPWIGDRPISIRQFTHGQSNPVRGRRAECACRAGGGLTLRIGSALLVLGCRRSASAWRRIGAPWCCGSSHQASSCAAPTAWTASTAPWRR